ncbi:ribose-5-phosphate isomerase [Thermohydrogenium kirishiense]|uniref:Ribose 5-phosphate isomerase B n=2 Tax=Thermoanaerobacterium thermosaccharolyticum TaxID=1517 RepID=A0A231VC04_THETR|nr:ribose 5-phosphate isomerase B [Thermoanaerobacterium thermosaccharolyticum]TCW35682.1 ribose-5-phosphate isomerase [Thermohydrogenium kirishiense]
MMIALGSDHAGYELKIEIAKYLKEKGIEYIDFGTYGTERVDYPIFALKVANEVASGKCEKGILFCGTGVGISIAANKVKGIRAVVCSEPYSAALSRAHNNTNILALGSRVVGLELAKMIVDQWLNTPYEGGRHQKRIDQISKIERGEQID